jgi:hypothetical protein
MLCVTAKSGFGSKADIPQCPSNVRFAPESGHQNCLGLVRPNSSGSLAILLGIRRDRAVQKTPQNTEQKIVAVQCSFLDLMPVHKTDDLSTAIWYGADSIGGYHARRNLRPSFH